MSPIRDKVFQSDRGGIEQPLHMTVVKNTDWTKILRTVYILD
jgi:hypothetical protein